MTKGGRNILLLGVGSIAVAVLTTGVSLAVYHNSGDIYLDRSRPGFLPDNTEKEEEQKTNETYKFSENGNLDKSALSEYLKNMQPEVDRVNKIQEPFDPNSLSDDALDIKENDSDNGSDQNKNVDIDQNKAQHIND